MSKNEGGDDDTTEIQNDKQKIPFHPVPQKGLPTVKM
jgi:hypothetical protein